jgi:23S rRNA (pseudouridine1915-N3)-methyltransferase
MSIHIVTIGRKHEYWIAEGIERYQKRLKRPFDIEWVILPHSSLTDVSARQDESRRIISRLNSNDYVILSDELGKNISSPDLSSLLLNPLESSKQTVIIIGGAYGVDDTIHKRANFIWSLSHLVFPHQMVRLMLTEQIYRAQEIANNRPYHHE